MSGIFGDGSCFRRDDEDERLRHYIPGLGLVLPVIGLDDPCIVKRLLGPDEYVWPGSNEVH